MWPDISRFVRQHGSYVVWTALVQFEDGWLSGGYPGQLAGGPVRRRLRRRTGTSFCVDSTCLYGCGQRLLAVGVLMLVLASV